MTAADFLVFDSSIPVADDPTPDPRAFGIHRLNWIRSAFMSRKSDATFHTDLYPKADIEAIAKVIVAGDNEYRVVNVNGWPGTLPLSRGAMLQLDAEEWMTPANVVHMLRTYRAADPGSRIGYYPFCPFGIDHKENFSRAFQGSKANTARTAFYRLRDSRDNLDQASLCDYLSPDLYFRGVELVEWDFVYFSTLLEFLAVYRKPVYAEIYGVRPDGSLVDRQTLERLYKLLRAKGVAGVIIFGVGRKQVQHVWDVFKTVTAGSGPLS